MMLDMCYMLSVFFISVFVLLENKLDIYCWTHFLRAIAFRIDSDLTWYQSNVTKRPCVRSLVTPFKSAFMSNCCLYLNLHLHLHLCIGK